MRCYEIVNYTRENICRRDGIGISENADHIMVGNQVVYLADDIVTERQGMFFDRECFDQPSRLMYADGYQFDGELILNASAGESPCSMILCRIRRHGFHILRYEAQHPLIRSRVYDKDDADHYEEELLALLSPGETIKVIRSKVARINGEAIEYDQFENTIEFHQIGFPICKPDYSTTINQLLERSR